MYRLRLLAVATVIFVGSAVAGSAQQPAAIVDGKIIAAIRASGGTVPQDGQVARAGADAAT
jgi:uncharacterized protein GlcG (DUF336 family)